LKGTELEAGRSFVGRERMKAREATEGKKRRQETEEMMKQKEEEHALHTSYRTFYPLLSITSSQIRSLGW
jgi:hypothetical protein